VFHPNLNVQKEKKEKGKGKEKGMKIDLKFFCWVQYVLFGGTTGWMS
jgi:hypothetical protein